MTGVREPLALLAPSLRARRRSLGLALLLALLGSATALAEPLAIRAVIDSVTDGSSLAAPVAVLVALAIADALAQGLRSLLVTRVAEGAVLDLRLGLVAHVLRLPVPEHDRRRGGDLLSRVGTDTTLLRDAVTMGVFEVLVGLATFLGAIVFMAVIDPVLLGVALVAVLGGGAVVLLVTTRVRGITEEGQAAVGAMTAELGRALGAIRTVRASGAEGRELDVVGREARAAYAAGLRLARLEALVFPLTSLAVQGAFVLVLVVGGARVASGAIGLGDFVAFVTYVFLVALPLAQVAMAVVSLQKGLAALGRVAEIRAVPTEGAQEEAPAVPTIGPARLAPARVAGRAPAVALDGVSFAYRPELPVLRDVSFAVEEGSHTALVGPSGAGKSTVLALLERFYDPDAGRILLGGVDVRDLPRERLRSALGYVEQEAPVMAGTVRENLVYARPSALEKDLEEVLDLANLRDLVDRLPDGLDTQVGDAGVLLSGGERQRIAIARALIARPRVLLLDEPTAQLDSRNELALRATVARAARERTLIVVAHRLATVVAADQIVVMERGAVRAVGTHHELLAADALYRELAEGQLLGEGATPTAAA